MTNSRPRAIGTGAADAGALMLAVSALRAAGAGAGPLVGGLVPRAPLWLGVGLFLGIHVITERFHEI